MSCPRGFAPIGIRETEACQVVRLGRDEYEVIRLLDLQALTQAQCAKQMGISRTTVTGIYEAARRKIADAVVNGKRLMIEGGNVALCDRGETCRTANGLCCCTFQDDTDHLTEEIIMEKRKTEYE